jgi:hypothetical protein
MNATDLKSLHGRVVLVRSKRDNRNPPVALRGTIEVLDRPNGASSVMLAVEFPQMFTTPAHRRDIPLTEADIAQLLASEERGTFEFMLDGDLF